MKRDRRRIYPIVKPSLQYRFLGFILGYNFIIIIFMASFFLIPDMYQLDDLSQCREVRIAVADRILDVHAKAWPAMLALMCLIGLHSFRVFHRFVGPLYRFERVFDSLRDGDFSLRARLRKKDYLHSEAETINSMIEALSERIGNLQETHLEAMESLREIEKTLGQADGRGNSGELEALLMTLRHTLEKLEGEALYFKIHNTAKDEE